MCWRAWCGAASMRLLAQVAEGTTIKWQAAQNGIQRAALHFLSLPQIVFSEGWWVGTAEENPEERRLPEPDWLAQPPLHSKFDFSTRGEAAGE